MRRGTGLVLVQVACIAAIFLWPGQAQWSVPSAVRWLALLAQFLGAGLILTGALALGRDLTVWASPKQGAGLRTTGAYAISRNPIYAGLLVLSAGQILLRGRAEPVVAFVVLAVVLHLKTDLEQANLRAAFGEAYTEYAARVPKLLGIPRRDR